MIDGRLPVRPHWFSDTPPQKKAIPLSYGQGRKIRGFREAVKLIDKANPQLVARHIIRQCSKTRFDGETSMFIVIVPFTFVVIAALLAGGFFVGLFVFATAGIVSLICAAALVFF